MDTHENALYVLTILKLLSSRLFQVIQLVQHVVKLNGNRIKRVVSIKETAVLRLWRVETNVWFNQKSLYGNWDTVKRFEC